MPYTFKNNDEKPACTNCRYCDLNGEEYSKAIRNGEKIDADNIRFYECLTGHEDMDASSCNDYKYDGLSFPIAVMSVDVPDPDDILNAYSSDCLYNVTDDTGRVVEVEMLDDSGAVKKYRGVFITDAPMQPSISFDEVNHKLSISYIRNPLIFIPSERRFVFGAECNWHRLDEMAM